MRIVNRHRFPVRDGPGLSRPSATGSVPRRMAGTGSGHDGDRRGLCHEVHALLAEDASRDRRDAGCQITDTLTRIGLELEGIEDPGSQTCGFPRRACCGSNAAPECRSAASMQGRFWRQRTGHCRVWRTERAHRHEGRVRRTRQLHSRHRSDPEGRRNSRREERGHVAVRARDGPGRRSFGHHGPSRRRTDRHGVSAMGRAGRSDHRRQRDTEPRRLLFRARHRARSRRRRHRNPEAVAAGEGGAGIPGRPALADRLA